jgi:hypothetical protein
MTKLARIAAGITATLLVASPVLAAEAKAKSAPPPAVDPAVVALVTGAGDRLRAAERFSFTAETSYEVVQGDGSKLEFGATRRYVVRRPDRVRLEVEPRDGESRLIVFDGDRLTVAQPGAKVYAQLAMKQHRSIDEAVVLLREVLDVPVPLGELLLSDPRPDLVGSLTAAYRVGTARIAGADCDHVALRNADTDVQLWIERGETPLLRRVVIRYRKETGTPSFAATLSDWSLDAKAPDDAFVYAPPADAERVRFAVDARPPKAAASKGAEKAR